MKKKLLALLCVVCVLATTLFTGIPNTVVSATSDTSKTEEQLTWLTLSDIGIATGSQNIIGNTYEAGFHNTMISFYDTVTKSGNYPRIHLGGRKTNSREGIGLLFNPDGNLVISGSLGYSGAADRKISFNNVTVKASDFGYTESGGFFGQRILLQLQTQIMAFDADGTYNDIRFTVFINKTQAAQIDIRDQVEKLGNYLMFCDGTHKLGGYKELEHSAERQYDFWTTSDVGVSDCKGEIGRAHV